MIILYPNRVHRIVRRPQGTYLSGQMLIEALRLLEIGYVLEFIDDRPTFLAHLIVSDKVVDLRLNHCDYGVKCHTATVVDRAVALHKVDS